VPIYESLPDVPTVPGRYLARIPVTVDLNGHEVAVWTHVLVGAAPGPTLLLLAGVHGNEWGHIEFLARYVRDFRPPDVCGTVLVVPTANPAALGQLTRAVPDDSDQPDLNRSFPGEGRRFTWLAEQLATTVASELITRADAVLDFHIGIWGSAMGSSIVGTDYSDGDVNRRSMDLALVFGTPLIFASRVVGSFPGPRSLLGYAAERAGVPVNPKTGGLLLPVHATDTFGRPVLAGEVLGRVVSPYSLEVIEELVAPTDGYLGYWSRDYPVHPGDWAFGVIPKDHPGTKSFDLIASDVTPWRMTHGVAGLPQTHGVAGLPRAGTSDDRVSP
jgi:predicted deacylase